MPLSSRRRWSVAKAKVLGLKVISIAKVTVKTAFMLATVINAEFAKIEASFLASGIIDTLRRNGFSGHNSSNLSDLGSF